VFLTTSGGGQEGCLLIIYTCLQIWAQSQCEQDQYKGHMLEPGINRASETDNWMWMTQWIWDGQHPKTIETPLRMDLQPTPTKTACLFDRGSVCCRWLGYSHGKMPISFPHFISPAYTLDYESLLLLCTGQRELAGGQSVLLFNTSAVRQKHTYTECTQY
jgi:hypothetical protein